MPKFNQKAVYGLVAGLFIITVTILANEARMAAEDGEELERENEELNDQLEGLENEKKAIEKELTEKLKKVNEIKQENKELSEEIESNAESIKNKEKENKKLREQLSEFKGAKTLYMEATAYGPNCDGCHWGKTKTGIDYSDPNNLPKVIAVDPKVIPLGSKVHVEGYGYAIAGDTGSAIKGNIIDVLVESEEWAAKHWGRRHNVKVTILE